MSGGRVAAFVEVSSPGWAFWRAVLDSLVGFIVGTLYIFVGIVVMGVVGEEALSSLYGQVDLDPLFRTSMGVILLAAAVLAIVVPLVFVAERYAALRAAEAAALTHPDAVPQSALRGELAEPPAVHLRTTGLVLFWCLVGLGTLCALAVIFAEDLREDPVMWIVLLGFVVLASGAELLRRLGRRLVIRDAPRTAALAGRWKRLLPRAESEDADRRAAAPVAVVPRWLTAPSARTLHRIANALLAATVVALAAFMLSVYMRQQCRTCDPVYWDEPIENGIDVLSLSSGVAIAVCAALGILAWIGGVALQSVRERALARWVSDGSARRVDVAVVAPLISGHRSTVRLQFGLSSVGAGAIVLATAALWSDWPGMDPTPVLATAGGLLAVGFLLGVADAPRRARERQAARDAMFPGDVGAPAEAASESGSREPARRRKRRE